MEQTRRKYGGAWSKAYAEVDEAGEVSGATVKISHMVFVE